MPKTAVVNTASDTAKVAGNLASKAQARQLIPPNPYVASSNKKQNSGKDGGKFSEFLIAEKQRKFVRVPRLFGKRTPMLFKCPHCKNDREQRTKLKHECTGN